MTGVFLEDLRVAEALATFLALNFPRGVGKLTPLAIRTVEVFMVLLAELGLVPGRHVFLLLQLEVPMGEGARVCELTGAVQFPVATHL